MTKDEQYMQRCLELAIQGLGNVAPNPMVGAVIVHNGKIIGEGHHQKCGEAHAEVNAIYAVHNKELLKESTIYVSLEPCAHFGKTPPCSDLIIRMGIPRVVIGCVDSFSEVSGKGIEKLENAGTDVTVGILEKEARFLNRRFFKFHEKQKAYAIVKWAQTQDGFIDQIRTSEKAKINWITQPETQSLVHKWRAEESGILVGRQTIINDNPSLTVRSWIGKNPTRIVIDPSNALFQQKKQFAIFNDEANTIVLNKHADLEEDTNRWVKMDDLSPSAILHKLYELEIQSVIVEGGTFTIQQFIDSGEWDEARILTGTTSFETGLKAPLINSSYVQNETIGKDQLTLIYK